MTLLSTIGQIVKLLEFWHMPIKSMVFSKDLWWAFFEIYTKFLSLETMRVEVTSLS